MTVVPLPKDRHAQVQALLPWYVSAQLDADDMRLVQEHLQACLRCRAELETEEALQQQKVRWEGVETARTGGVAHQGITDAADAQGVDAGLLRMDARIRALDSVPVQDGPTGGHWLRYRAWHGWRWVALLQGASIVLLAALLWASGRHAPGNAGGPAPYRALSAPSAMAQDQALTMFRPDATEQQLRQALHTCGARLVHGPTASDAYVLQLEGASRASTAPIACLRAQTIVLMVEPLNPAALLAPAHP